MPDDSRLVVLIEGRKVGVVTMAASGRLTFTYDDGWPDTKNAIPLSLSMPLAQQEHGDGPVRAFLWGLLPDSEQVLDRWARTYHVSAGNPFALLCHVGEDCAGAAQFVTPERVDAIMAGDGGVNWMDPDEIGERLRVLRRPIVLAASSQPFPTPSRQRRRARISANSGVRCLSVLSIVSRPGPRSAATNYDASACVGQR